MLGHAWLRCRIWASFCRPYSVCLLRSCRLPSRRSLAAPGRCTTQVRGLGSELEMGLFIKAMEPNALIPVALWWAYHKRLSQLILAPAFLPTHPGRCSGLLLWFHCNRRRCPTPLHVQPRAGRISTTLLRASPSGTRPPEPLHSPYQLCACIQCAQLL